MIRAVLSITLISAVVFAATNLVGCGYTTRGLYPEQYQTIAVPIFKSKFLRRDIEFELTHAVITAIESRTPFKVMDEARADTTLEIELVELNKASAGEDSDDNPVGGIYYIGARTRWTDNINGKVLGEQTIRLPPAVWNVQIAESEATARREAANQLANQVVTLLQSPW